MENDIKQQLKEIAGEFLQKVSLADATFDIEEQGENRFRLAIEADTPKLYIGERGLNLRDMQHVLRLVVRKKIDSPTPPLLDVDINNYKQAQVNFLKENANSIADDVAVTKIPKSLEPMTPYERRVVHAELSLRDDVTTESVGEGPERHIVIKPKSIV